MPYRTPAPPPRDLARERFERVLREVQESFRLMSLCRCREKMKHEGCRSYVVMVRDFCPIHDENGRLTVERRE